MTNYFLVSYSNKIIQTKTKRINLEIWDTAGQERFRVIAPIYYRKASAIIIVYDITNRLSYDRTNYWINEIELNGNPHCIKFLVGNKMDMGYDKSVSTEVKNEYFK